MSGSGCKAGDRHEIWKYRTNQLMHNILILDIYKTNLQEYHFQNSFILSHF